MIDLKYSKMNNSLTFIKFLSYCIVSCFRFRKYDSRLQSTHIKLDNFYCEYMKNLRLLHHKVVNECSMDSQQ